MAAPLKISIEKLIPSSHANYTLDLAGRCAFVVCTKGDLDIKILNNVYHISEKWMFACMPFIDAEVISVSQPSEILLGQLRIEDVPSIINSMVNISNLSAIQQQPLVEITGEQFRHLMNSIEGYLIEYEESELDRIGNKCIQIHRNIIDYHSRLIVAQVLKIYFSNMRMDVTGHSHRDVVFQQFMLNLYANFRKHRSVEYYARKSGVSLKYFSTVIRQFSGVSPSKWIETVVISEAKTMLGITHCNIKEIATTLNFPDAPTFTKYFVRVTGLTPRSYRQTILP